MENFHSVPSEAAADVGPSTSTADSLDAAEPAQNKSTKEAASLTEVEPEPTKSTIAADSLTAVEPAPTKSTTAADSLTAAEPAPTKSTNAADSLTGGEPAPTKSTNAAASLTAAELALTKSTNSADGLTADEPELSHTNADDSTVSGDSGPASHIGLDYVVDLPLYKESTRYKPHADPEPTPGSCTCYSLDSIQMTNLTLLISFSEEEIFYTASSDEESSFIPDIEEGLPATQAPVDNFDASASAEPINHSMNPLRVGGYLRAPAIAHIPFLPSLWLVSSLFSVITWMKIQIQHAWHEENGQGALTDKKVGSD